MAAKKFQIEGLNELVQKLQKAEGQILNNVNRGIKKAGLFLQRESMLLVPIQTGNLRASAFTRASGKGKDFSVVVGYTASYAVFVHENLDAAHGKAFNIKHADKIAESNANLRGAGGRVGGWVAPHSQRYENYGPFGYPNDDDLQSPFKRPLGRSGG